MSLIADLEDKIKAAYEGGISMEDAELLAGEFLYAQLQLSEQLKTADLDARMRKAGLKAIRAAIYLDAASKGDGVTLGKRPTEATLAATVDSNDLVMGEQRGLDEAEADKANLDRVHDTFIQSHHYFKQLAKGSMG